MRVRVLVKDERAESFPKKNGQIVNQRRITCADMSREGMRLTGDMSYALSAEEAAKYSGKLRDRFIQLDIGRIEFFAGVVKVPEGSVFEVEK